MFFRKSKSVLCAVCNKPIEPKEPRFADKNRVTKVERHVHIGCLNRDRGPRSIVQTKVMHTGAGESSVTSVFVSMPVGRSILNTTVTPLFCPSANT